MEATFGLLPAPTTSPPHHLTTLPPLDIFMPECKGKCFSAENWISEDFRSGNHSPAFSDWDQFVKLSHPKKVGWYKNVISPHEYADYFHRWGSISTV
eukprot:scaffold296594_cov70-Attheya_sp.AAC.1